MTMMWARIQQGRLDDWYTLNGLNRYSSLPYLTGEFGSCEAFSHDDRDPSTQDKLGEKPQMIQNFHLDDGRFVPINFNYVQDSYINLDLLLEAHDSTRHLYFRKRYKRRVKSPGKGQAGELV